jgi:hypothetical protein
MHLGWYQSPQGPISLGIRRDKEITIAHEHNEAVLVFLLADAVEFFGFGLSQEGFKFF